MRVQFPFLFRGAVQAACLAALLFLTACATAQVSGGGPPTQAVTPTMDMQVPATAPASAGTVTAIPVTGPRVVISNFTFSPAALTVPVGTTVTWINQDDTIHTVTETNPDGTIATAAPADRRFSSPGLDTGDTFSYKFTIPGTYTYACTLHPQMVGKIIVQ